MPGDLKAANLLPSERVSGDLTTFSTGGILEPTEEGIRVPDGVELGFDM